MPPRIREYLNNRGISDKVIFENGIYWTGLRIAIPVTDENGNVLFNKYRRDPQFQIGPKYSFDRGATVDLYGRKNLNARSIIICEGEFDCMVLEANGYASVTSTAGAGTFKQEWVKYFVGKEVFVCLDNDKAGREGAEKICRLIPQAKIIALPPGIKDVTELFMQKTKRDFDILIQVAFRPDNIDPPPAKKHPPRRTSPSGSTNLERAKQVPIANYLKLDHQGKAICPLHKEKTPSFQVYQKANRFKCYGCGKYGDVIDLVKEMFNFSLSESIEYILK